VRRARGGWPAFRKRFNKEVKRNRLLRGTPVKTGDGKLEFTERSRAGKRK